VSEREEIRLRFLARFAENQSIEGAAVNWDGLSTFEELVLKEMTDEGLVTPTSYSCKDEGRYRLTSLGRQEYEEIRRKRLAWSVVQALFGKAWMRAVLIIPAILAIYHLLSPSWLCPLLPDQLAVALERCEAPLRSLTP